MIPAILSVAFVVYLYQSLQETSSNHADASSSGSVNSNTTGEIEQLTMRLQTLRAKVDKLTQQAQQAGK